MMGNRDLTGASHRADKLLETIKQFVIDFPLIDTSNRGQVFALDFVN